VRPLDGNGDPNMSGTTKAELKWAYDYNSNPTARYDVKMDASKWTQLYTYDGLNRLTKTEQGDFNGTWPTSLSVSATGKKTWDWDEGGSRDLDKLGNWINFDNDGTVVTSTINAANELQTRTTGGGSVLDPVWDDNGNLTETDENSEGTAADERKYVYDYHNRLIKVTDRSDTTLAEYVYDGMGRRVKKDLPSGTDVRYLYNGWQSIQEQTIEATPKVLARYVYGLTYLDEVIRMDRDGDGDGDLYDDTGSGESFNVYFLQDLIYNVVALVDDSGTVQERYWYEPYGVATITNASGTGRSSSSYDNEHLYTGQRYCAETSSSGNFGLYYYKRRHYDATFGRFVNRDPISYGGGLSLYAYVRARPTIFIDALGLEEKCVCGPDVTDEFFDAVLRTVVRMKYQVGDKDKGKYDGLKFLYRNGINIDFVAHNDPGRNCPKGQPCLSTMTLCKTCIHWTQIGNIMYGLVSRLLGVPDATSEEAANAHNFITHGTLEGPVQQSSYAIGRTLQEWADDPEKPLTATAMCKALKSQISKWETATQPGKFKKCSPCAYKSGKADKDFSVMPWSGAGGITYKPDNYE